MTAAMELFAERGFDGTSVGEIERAAGLAPRSGALYQHFKGGKDELLRCAIEHELRAIDELGSVMEMLPLGNLRAELTLLARWNLGSLERRSAPARFVRRDAARLAAGLPDLLQRSPARRGRADRKRPLGGRYAAVAVDRRRPRDGVQLLSQGSAVLSD
jgi:AcrR family transcriptional regulator